MKISFLIVGTNFISDRFIDAVSRVEGVDIAAVYSRTQERADAYADKYGIVERYSDYTAALASCNINAVYVANPNFAHRDTALLAIRAGKHVLCEKIITENLADFLLLKEEAEKHGVVLLEAMRPDFDPSFSILQRSISQIGKVRRVAFEYCQYSSRYDAFLDGNIQNAFNPEIGNSSLADIGIYPLHMLVSLFGEPTRVTPLFVTLHNGFMGCGHLALDYTDQGFFATVDYSKITDGKRPSVIEGEKGTLLIDRINATENITLALRGEEPRIIYHKHIDNNMTYEVEAFRDMVCGFRSEKPYLLVTEQTMRTYDKALAT
ncbi:MAG: Gfo/Idh/MocA family oxidoreductase [Clostridia bacterium]|nr:Gfo/Idh/MocA family oxidoreductase [Clostridia bacterium]